MKLIIAHYHLRPGGVRRVIEDGARALVACNRLEIREIVLFAGEPPDAAWRATFQRGVGGTTVRYFIRPSFGYVSELSTPPARISREIRGALAEYRPGLDAESVVWFHNAGLGRNLFFLRELQRACDRAEVPLLLHHHDWWFDNRWQRWPEFRRCGFRTLESVARILFPALRRSGHAAINSVDAALLTRCCAAPVAWMPNPALPAKPVTRARRHAARAWLRDQLESDAPVWILPCRMLRRKNVAEALLLTRWLRPGAILVTTGGVSSSDEQTYFDKFAAAVARHRWPARLAVLRGDERRKPSVAALIAASEAVLLTSIQEGFGLPYLEAAAAGRPLIARRLPNITPDLIRFGFRFHHLYDDLQVPPALFDARAEQARQRRLVDAWESRLPRTVRRGGRNVIFLNSDGNAPVPFSHLSLTAQLEVLAHPPEASWSACAPLNPVLCRWRKAAMAGALPVEPWPRSAKRWLGGEAYARHFEQLLAAVRKQRSPHPRDRQTQRAFIRDRHDDATLHPLLLAPDT